MKSIIKGITYDTERAEKMAETGNMILFRTLVMIHWFLVIKDEICPLEPYEAYWWCVRNLKDADIPIELTKED